MTHPTSTLQHAMLLAPLIRSTGWTTMRWVYFLCKPFLSSVKRHFIPSSHNRIFNDFLKHHDPIQSQRVFLKWLGAMEEWYQQMREPHASSNTTPITIIQGTGDMTVDWKYNIPILQQSFNHTHVHYIKKAKHQLVNESRKYWQKVTHIMEQTLQAPADTSP